MRLHEAPKTTAKDFFVPLAASVGLIGLLFWWDLRAQREVEEYLRRNPARPPKNLREYLERP